MDRIKWNKYTKSFSSDSKIKVGLIKEGLIADWDKSNKISDFKEYKLAKSKFILSNIKHTKTWNENDVGKKDYMNWMHSMEQKDNCTYEDVFSLPALGLKHLWVTD